MKIHGIPQLARIDEWVEASKKYDIAFEYNDFFVPSFLEDEAKVDAAIEKYMSVGRDLSNDTMHGAFLDVVVGSSDPRINEVSMFRIRQSLDIARKMGLKGVVFHTNYITNLKLTSYINGWLDANEKTFTKLCADYPELNIYMENMFDVKPDLLKTLAERMKDVKNFAVCLDLAHAYLSGSSLDGWINEIAPYARHFHINDNFCDEDSHLAVGDGNFPWEVMNRDIIKNLDASCLIEVRGLENFVKSIEYMKKNKIYPYL